MFRKMRRAKQQLSEDEAREILIKGKTGILGVLGDEGYPYTVPINYVYDNEKIYFHGSKHGHKYDAIKKCSKVSFCVVEKDEVIKEELTTYYRSVIIFGKAKILEKEEDIFQAAEIFGLKYNDNKAFLDKEIKRELNVLCCIEITIEHITGKEAIGLTGSSSK